MTSVVFVAKCNVAYDATTNVGITLTGITIDGAKYSGTLTVENPAAGGGTGDLTASWSDLGSQVDHVAARLWDSGNTGVKIDEGAFSSLDLTATATAVDASHPFGDAYVLLPAQAAVPFTIHYRQHNGFKADGTTKLDVDHQYQVTPSGTWAMGKKNIYSLNFTLTEIQVTPEVTNWDNKPIEQLLPDPTNGHAFVDLGLRQSGNKVLFATANIGAESETEMGDYFQWGDIAKRYTSIEYSDNSGTITGGFSFNWASCPWTTDGESFTKYNATEGKTSLDEEDDAAHVLWGGGWHMPTKELFELLLNCSHEFTIYEGVKGLLFHGQDGYLDAFLFLPAAGIAQDSSISYLNYQKYTAYWSSALGNTYDKACALYFEYNTSQGWNCARFYGMPIRPVLVIPDE